MARVHGVREKLHLPHYDAFFVPKDTTFQSEMEKRDPRVIRFFVDVQNKTRLETNLQASGVLPSLNTFEARAMRVVVSTAFRPAIERSALADATGLLAEGDKAPAENRRTASEDRFVHQVVQSIIDTRAVLEAADSFRRSNRTAADQDQLARRIEGEFTRAVTAASAAAGRIVAELIYNSVTSLLVGEKIMIEMPTYWFPAGAGVSSGSGLVNNHGEPDPMATFRFAEPVFIEPQQNFRVEMLFPQGLPDALRGVLGPLRIWVVLDGFLTRDVQ